MRILVYGAGVIGCNLAAGFLSSGKDVTLLARRNWAEQIENNGLTIDPVFSIRKKTYSVKVIRELKKDDRYDVIFVVMRYTQLDSIISILNDNTSENIVFVGNNLSGDRLIQLLPDKKVMFGFYMAAGHRERDRVVSLSFRRITIGPFKKGLEQEGFAEEIFKDTKIKVTYQPNMEDYLLCHAAFVIPVGFACYYCDGDLKKIKGNKAYLNQIIDANIEGYEAIENAGHEILPKSDRDYHSHQYRRLCYTVYKVMCSTRIGKICASDHALNAVEEMEALNHELKNFFKQHHAKYPNYQKLEKDAEKYLK